MNAAAATHNHFTPGRTVLTTDPAARFAFDVTGDGMLPEYPPDSIVICAEAEIGPVIAYHYGSEYALALCEADAPTPLLCQVHKAKAKGKIILHWTADDHGDRIIDAADVAWAARVLAVQVPEYVDGPWG